MASTADHSVDPGRGPSTATRWFALALLLAAAVVAFFAIRSTAATDETAIDETATNEAAATEAVPTDTDATPAPTAVPTPIEAPPILGVEGDLVDLDGWLQSDITSLDDLDGQVHIVQFWTFGCYNCKNTLANLSYLNEKYGGDDFSIVGVHAPEFEREKDPDAILAAAESLGVTWPIALDTEKKNFRSWQGSRRFWPRTYVVDQEGNIRFDRIGEGAYAELEEAVAYLLEHGPSSATSSS